LALLNELLQLDSFLLGEHCG